MQIKQMLDERYSSAVKVRLVMDNLNTHTIASLYETFEPKEARRLAERLDIHYTPKHGSWLNMAEIELSALKGQCLDRRIPDITTMRVEVNAWEKDRNNSAKNIVWQFTTPDARIKLKHLYLKLPRNDGHTEKLEIKRERLGGVQWRIRESEEVLTKNSRKK
jgi:transposase